MQFTIFFFNFYNINAEREREREREYTGVPIGVPFLTAVDQGKWIKLVKDKIIEWKIKFKKRAMI